jgi:hypothetical protein
LKLWKKRIERAKELKVAIPDPSNLLKALDAITSKAINGDSKRTFRIESAREEIGVDTITTTAAVNKLVLLVEGELEECANSSWTTVSEVRSIKGKGKDGKGKEARKEPCYYFNEAEDGCNRGQHCTRYHRKLNQDEKKCYVCGSSKHMAGECDRPKKEDPPQTKGTSKGDKGKSGK